MSALAEGTFAWYSLAWIRDQEHGSWMIFALLLLVWIADTGAYFVGRRFGRRKLAPKISPGKTVEGLVGGLLLSALVLTAAAHASGWVTISPFLAFALLLLIGLTSVGGDLFISLQKRTVRLADTGRLLPGHGGVYDRFDSLAASAALLRPGPSAGHEMSKTRLAVLGRHRVHRPQHTRRGGPTS